MLFSHFPNLTELHLESTGIDSIEFVAGLPKLQYLNITDNNVTRYLLHISEDRRAVKAQ